MTNLNETFLMHTESGDVATKQEWLDDFNRMDKESWFGVEANEENNWLCDRDAFDVDCFVEVKQDEQGEWVEV